ncbi:PHD-finger domain-containing protein [Xylariales sp. AK1849]|nr:PHD-finger domain-containing protein [Xylariales sp. AK1849]
MATAAEAEANSGGPVDDEAISPTNKTNMASAMQASHPLESINMRADPDAQATVTDYLDFTEYLPADVNRSLTLIGKLDQTYIDASTNVDSLTTTWGKLPTLPADQRPVPVQLRSDISDNLNRAVSSRVSSYAEACRMADYVNRHVNRAKAIYSKLQIMRENYPTEEQKSPVQTRSPQMTRAKVPIRLDKDGKKVQRPPRISVPGEVLAPYEMDFTAYSSSSEESSEEEMSVSPPRRLTPAPRIKLVKTPKLPKLKVPKQPRPPREPKGPSNAVPLLSTSTALAKLKPPPENAVLGSSDAPWLQLTPYELAKLRKRMKKNAVWNPSDTMIARELKTLGRGVEAYRAAMKKAEDEGKPFEDAVPAPVVDAESGAQHPPAGAISAEALGAEEVQLSNRGMKLNEAKKLKREQLAKQAVEEAEESARKMAEAARMFFSHEASPSVAGSVAETVPASATASQPATQSSSAAKAPSKSKGKKRKADSMSEAGAPEIKTEASETPAVNANPPGKPQLKRTKTETPVPPPQLTPRPASVPPPVETPVPPPHVVQATPMAVTSATPVPLPVQPSSEASIAGTRPTASPSSGTSPVPVPPNPVTTTVVPTKPPASTPVPPPKTSTTPIPAPTRDLGKRETRKDAQKTLQPIATNAKQSNPSRPNTPVTTPDLDQQSTQTRRPLSRGKASSVEPPATLAADRPRRTSTARTTPAPEVRQPSKRLKRPAPGVVSTTSGGTSAVGKRKAAPRKRPRGHPKKGAQNHQVEQEVEVEVDDDGNVIDPDEPRYCLCNRVSFGTMIQCDNIDNCKQEWFHLECVGLAEIPPRTTKWYCPDCRVLLNIGGRGEVTSRGVKM